MFKKSDLLVVYSALLATGISVLAITFKDVEPRVSNDVIVEARPIVVNVATVDIDQLIADMEGKPGTVDWLEFAVNKYCGSNCLLLNRDSVLKGEYVDLNEAYRKEVGITEPRAKFNKEESKLLLDALEKLKTGQAEDANMEPTLDEQELLEFFKVISTSQTESSTEIKVDEK